MFTFDDIIMEKYGFLMTNTDPYILVWLGDFIYQFLLNEMK